MIWICVMQEVVPAMGHCSASASGGGSVAGTALDSGVVQTQVAVLVSERQKAGPELVGAKKIKRKKI